MGAACCVAAKDRTIVNGSSGETLQIHARDSPSWSFRWDNRGRVAEEDRQPNLLNDGGGGNDQMEIKSCTTVKTSFASEEGSPLNSLRLSWQKSPVSDASASILKLPVSDDFISRNLVEVKGLAQSPSISHPSPVKLSPSVPSLSTSPQSSHSHLLPPNSTPSIFHRHSPGHQSYKSSTISVSGKAFYESTRASNGGHSDSWPIPVFSEHPATRRQRWSFDSDNSGFSLDNISRGGRSSGSPTDHQTCGVCSKLLTERSSWGWTSQKIVSTNELSVVSVLACGHVYHAECLEYLTPEVNKYDPPCPGCTHGERRAVKMQPEKALKAQKLAKARKRYGKRIVDSDLKSSIWFDHPKMGGIEEAGPKISSGTSVKSSVGKPFLKRHFSLNSKAGKLPSANQSAQSKSFFWARSSKG